MGNWPPGGGLNPPCCDEGGPTLVGGGRCPRIGLTAVYVPFGRVTLGDIVRFWGEVGGLGEVCCCCGRCGSCGSCGFIGEIGGGGKAARGNATGSGGGEKEESEAPGGEAFREIDPRAEWGGWEEC
mmetsp:Transcript_19557/g.26954  ORF Transcript_19557/g.26954 Transcript_19557/m.26954 type:complete len:126 (+) Transcript_19557:170-547(+)